MSKLVTAAFGAAMLVAGSAGAVEVTGGSVQLSYSGFTEDTSVSRLGLEGSVELGFNRNMAVQVDLGHSRLNESDAGITTYGLHGIYHVNDATSVGLFYAVDDTSDGNSDFYGVEVGHESGLMDFEGYLARADGGGATADVVGVSARYEMANTVGITGAYDYIDLDGVDLSKLSLRLDRDVAPNVNLYVEVGSAKVAGQGLSGSEPFVGLGGKYTFGAERGATFDARGLARLLPGG
ncbi:MAG: porin [Sulfitobacter sp.]